MNSSIIDRLLQIGSLKQRANSIVLARPVSIVVRANVLNEIRSVYEPSREHGGILIMKPAASRGEFVIDSVLVMPNVSNDPSVGFLPDAAAMTAATLGILKAGALPIVFHTHPTKLGINAYDSKAVTWFLNGSHADRRIGRTVQTLEGYSITLPEVIGIADERLVNKIAISFYEGGILPHSYSAITTAQWVAGGVALLAMYKFGKPLLVLLALVVAYEEYRKPKYTTLPNGDMLVEFRNATTVV